jgi:predicted amidohydrolase YtcJ
VKLGRDREVLRFIGKKMPIWNLHGAVVLPGFTDCHMHLVTYGFELLSANLKGARSIVEIQDAVRKQAENADSSKWVLGYGWDQEKLKEHRFPNRFDLDGAVPDRPVITFRVCGHMCAVNTQALRSANITAATTPPIGGVIDRDDKGDPVGLLRENAMNLVLDVAPAPDDREVRRAVSLAMKRAIRAGLTAVHCVIDEPQHVRVLQDMKRADELKLRIYLLIPDKWLASAETMGLSTGFGNDVLRIQGVKIFTDGSLGAQTAALEEPYSDAPETSGVLIHRQDELDALVESVARQGLQATVHAIGDRAIAMALSAIENANREVSSSAGLRHRIEHVSVLNPELMQRMKHAKIIASVQPHFKVSDAWVPQRVGAHRAKLVYALQSLRRRCMSIGGSDCPVEPIDPLEGIQAAVAKVSESYGEQVSPRAAVEMFTKNAAYATHEEKSKGSIEIGKVADLVVLDRNPLQVGTDEISKIKVLATIVGGRIVYASEAFRDMQLRSGRDRRAQRP